MKKNRNQPEVNQSQQAESEAIAEFENFLELYRQGKVKGAILSYQTEDGESKHHLMGRFAACMGAAMDQVRDLDWKLARRFFCLGR